MRSALDWFESLTGFYESSAAVVHAQLAMEGGRMTSRTNGRSFTVGRLEIASLAELRARLQLEARAPGRLMISQQVADVRDLHADPANAGGLFQVASQFNLLEMSSPEVTPESGVSIYQNDRTQGPACAIAAGAGTIYRNYFVPLRGQWGQSNDNQIDCLTDLGRALGNQGNRLWRMQNGYAFPSAVGLKEISTRIASMNNDARDQLRALLRIGVQWQTEVTASRAAHLVTQAYCSAMPVSYARHLPIADWEPFARLILEAAYEATLSAAVLNADATGSTKVFLTALGGGAFGNPMTWICDALERSLRLFQNYELQICIVSYQRADSDIARMLDRVSDGFFEH